MPLIKINLSPSKLELRWFGLIMLVFFALVGAIVRWSGGASAVSIALWSVGAGLCLVYYAVRPFRLPMYKGWMRAVFPIGWVVSHLAMAVIYYLLLTPIGVVRRLLGHDAMQRQLESEATTYWVEHEPVETSRYFRQF